MTRFSVICATLLRPSYHGLVASVRRQTLRDFEFVARGDSGDGINEYVVRNRAARQATGEFLVFVDDDSLLRPGHLARLAATIRDKPDTVAVSGCLQGNITGQGTQLVDQPGWWIGACLAIRRDVFLERPFEESWGLPAVPRGWRADSDIGFSIEERFPGRFVHDSGLVIDHPSPMGSVWQPAVEDVFFRRWRALVIKRFIDIDHRLQMFLLQTQDLTGAERSRVLRARADLRRKIPNLPVLPEEAE